MGSAVLYAEERKHESNDAKCAELGWVSIPLAVETYGCWGTEARWAFSQLASRLATRQKCQKSKAIAALYGRLNLTLVRANVRAILGRMIVDLNQLYLVGIIILASSRRNNNNNNNNNNLLNVWRLV